MSRPHKYYFKYVEEERKKMYNFIIPIEYIGIIDIKEI